MNSAALGYISTRKEAEYYANAIDRQSIVISQDLVIFGDLFVASAIFLNMPLVVVAVHTNPCAEID